MAQMKAWGYPLSEVEELVLKDPEPAPAEPAEVGVEFEVTGDPEADEAAEREALAELADVDEPTVKDEEDKTLVVVDGTIVAVTSHFDLPPVEEEPADEEQEPTRHLAVVPDPWTRSPDRLPCGPATTPAGPTRWAITPRTSPP
jgi:hypothetical protein